MTIRRFLVVTPLIMAFMLIAVGVVFILNARPAIGGGVGSVEDSGFTAMNGLGGANTVVAAGLPDNFEETEIVNGLMAPTNMEFSPDVRLFVLEQPGNILIIKNGELLPTPFLTIEADSSAEGGLLGIASDPQFNTNGHFYVYYTKTGDSTTNQVSRFTISAANPDVADPSSELVILDDIPADIQHNGGHMQFGLDGKLYITTGDATSRSRAHSLKTPLERY
jgi:glucose/arabinose dehydrogenase